jgi:hypothetical protein
MYLLLLVFGGLLTAAGIVLAASGVSIRDHAFDTTIMTPGVVAAVGGLLLIGLGLALRVLQRIERAIAARSMPQVARPGEPGLTTERPSEAVRIPFPHKPVSQAQAASVAPTAPASGGKDEAAEKIPLSARIETTTVVEDAELLLSPKSAPPFSTSVDVAVAEVDKGRAARRKNGAAPARVTPRLDVGPRSPLVPERPAGPAFDSLWPKGSRPARSAQAAPAQPAPAPIVEPEQTDKPVAEPAPAAVPIGAPEPVSVLKSGVVDGMAYTLYSDGSIEAQLPQGTLRFGSITELRNHIEQSA